MSDSASGTQADSKRRGSSPKNAPGNLVRSKIESKKIRVI